MEFIAQAVFINLDRRTDRRSEFEAECEKMGLSVKRFSAIDSSPGFVGCHKSHLAVLQMAKAEKWENVLIFEDDFMFLVDSKTFQEQLRQFFHSGLSYDVLMLSYNVQHGIPFNSLLTKVHEAQTASGYLVHSRFYDTLIHNLETNLALLETTGRHWLYLNDQCWKSLQPGANWYCFNLRLGKQRPSYSDLSNRFVDYGGM